MGVAPWVRQRLWRAENWCAELTRLRREEAAGPRGGSAAERLFDLASATEQCDPDRGRAMALYVEAWRAGHDGARARAKALALVMSAHMTVAEIARSEGDLVAAGTAFLDAGFPELAVEPLETFVAARPSGASAVTETIRLAGMRALLALARGTRFDAEREVADTVARAKDATGRVAAVGYLHAARIAKLAELDEDRLGAILNAASRACPDDDAIAASVETYLCEAGNTARLVDHFRARLDRATSPAQYSERARAAGMALIARNVQPGLGLRLLRLSLEHAYAAKLGDVASHIAVWELLATHARAQRTTLELVPLLVEAVAAPLGDDVAVYLARLGLEIAWRDAADTRAAQPYAATLLDFVPDHPLALELVQSLSSTPSAPSTTAPSATSPAPSTPSPAPSTTSAAQSPTKLPSRIPAIEGQVKRVAVSASTPERSVPSRLSLLKPPPARPTTLERDTSPIPVAPQPATPPAPRAPRKVMPIDVIIELPNGGFFSTLLRDVSTSGAFITTKRPLEIGTIVALDMQVPVTGALRQRSIRANARIVRRTDTGCGLAFIDPDASLVAALEAASAD